MNTLKTMSKWAGIVLLAILILAAIVPFLIPIKPLENLSSPQVVARPDSQFITIPFEGTDGIDIHYVADEAQHDEEPVFVLLHGSLFNVFTWNEVFDYFDGQGRVIAYDQIPYGLSEKLVEGDWTGINPYSADSAVKQLITLLDTLQVEEATLVGNSYGSVLAVQTALTHPDRVEALILADSAVYIQENLPAWVINLPQIQRLGVLFGRMIGSNEAFVRQTYRDPSNIDKERLELTLVHREVTAWDEAMWAYLQEWGTNPANITEQLPTLTQPSLVITGDGDTIVPPSDSERLANTLPNADYVVLASCGHVPQEECPAQFEDAVNRWLEKLNE